MGSISFAKYPARFLTQIFEERSKLEVLSITRTILPVLSSSENKWCPKGCGKVGRPHSDGKYKCERCGFEWIPESKVSK